MKKYSFSFVLSVVASFHTQAQVLAPEVSERLSPERIAVMRSTTIPVEQENLFWTIYAEYVIEARETDTGCSSFSANASDTGGDTWTRALISRNVDPSPCFQEMLSNQSKEVKLKAKYFDRVRNAVNGSVALQFLQTEMLMDLLHRSKMYESMDWSMPHWNASLLKNEEAKFDIIEFTLGIAPEQSRSFRVLFEDYQFEFSRIAGHRLFFFEAYVDDVAFFTPGHCNQLGNDFLKMQLDEIKLRQHFFVRISAAFDANLAARFLTLDDYFTSMEKLKVWSDNMVTVAQK
jgi:hypothetical protein